MRLNVIQFTNCILNYKIIFFYFKKNTTIKDNRKIKFKNKI